MGDDAAREGARERAEEAKRMAPRVGLTQIALLDGSSDR
jgi:hypothetical protein